MEDSQVSSSLLNGQKQNMASFNIQGVHVRQALRRHFAVYTRNVSDITRIYMKFEVYWLY